MNDFSGESRVEFWHRPESRIVHGEPGPHVNDYRDMVQCFDTNSLALEKEVIEGEKVLTTPMATFRTEQGQGKAYAFISRSKDVFGEAHKDIWLAIDPDVSDPAMVRVKIDAEGYLSLINDDETVMEADDKLDALVIKALEHVKGATVTKHNAEQWRREKRQNAIVGTVGTLTVLGIIGGSVWAGVDHWILEPRREKERYRNAYDKEHHTLEGTTISLGSNKIATMPKDAFNKIPERSDDDDLSNPRTIKITGNNCTTISGHFATGTELVFALPEGDPLIGSTVGATEDSAGKEIAICLVGKDSPGEDSKGGPDESKLAIQIQE